MDTTKHSLMDHQTERQIVVGQILHLLSTEVINQDLFTIAQSINEYQRFETHAHKIQ